jgi:serine/threonine protein kinase/tetratricopeptide (TPR) repeat protein
MVPSESDGSQQSTRIGAQKREAEPVEMGGVILHPGSRIDGYIFLREIGSGGMARVLLAKSPDDRLIALKVLRQSRFKTGLKRFKREYRTLTKVRHPNVVAVETSGDLFGHPYIAMEYVDGPDLHSLIRQFRTWAPEDRWRRVEEILIDLCRALSAVHRAGLVHRDLKPSNVLIASDGTCKLTDFGIVKNLDPTDDFMVSTTLVGTWAYASPEQITGAPIDHRSDLYSLGIILFAMLTGKRPFVASDMPGYLALHRDRPAPAPREVNRDVPEHLDEICRRLLQKSPRDRYQSAQEILYRLEAEEREVPVRSDDGWTPPLVGRQLEVEALTDAVSGLTARRGGVVVLEGDDGSGKSRLLEVAADRSRSLGLRILHLQFMTTEDSASGVTALARAVAEAFDGHPPKGLQSALQDFEDSDTTQVNSRYALFDAIRDALIALLDEQPQILLIDDLHQSQTRFIELLTYLTRALLGTPDTPLLIVATMRPKANSACDAFAEGDDLGIEPQRIAVGPLARTDIAKLLSQVLEDEGIATLLSRRLHRETEGTAFFVIEFLRSLIARGMLKIDQGGKGSLALQADEITSGHLEIPIGVRQMMRSRLDGIAEADRRALEVLAIAGRELDLDVLIDVLDQSEDVVLEHMENLLAAGIVRERRAGEVVLFVVSHRKFADVVYRDLATDERSRLHRRMAAALELHYAHNPAALEIVGEHYRHTNDAGRAYRYLVAAARRLRDRSLLQEAWALTDKAAAIEESALADLDKKEFIGFRKDLLDVRGEVLANRAEWAEAEGCYRLVLKLAEEDQDAHASIRARIELARILRRRRLFEEATAVIGRALEASRTLHDREGVAESLLGMAGLAWAEGRLDDVERLANEGLLVARGPQLSRQRAELLLALTAVQAIRGQLASATSGLTEAEGIFRELRQKRSRVLALSNLAELLTWQGQPMQARQRAHIALQVASDLDYKLGRVVAQRTMGMASLDLGKYTEARETLLSALLSARQIDLGDQGLACETLLAQLFLETGERSHALQFASEATRTESPDPENYVPLAKALLARACATQAPEDARAALAEATLALPNLPIPRRCQVELAIAHAYIELGEPESALPHARTVLQAAGGRGFRLLSLEARSLLAATTPPDEAATHRAVGQELVREFVSALSQELSLGFLSRPWIVQLGAAPSLDEDVEFESL